MLAIARPNSNCSGMWSDLSPGRRPKELCAAGPLWLRASMRVLVVLAVNHEYVVVSTVVIYTNYRREAVAGSIGAMLRQAREVRALSAVEAARAAGISAAYLNKLETDAVKRPSPHVLHALGAALGLPYVELMRLFGYPVPGDSAAETQPDATVTAALFADLTPDERDELLEYLAWYRARRRSSRGASAHSGANGG